MIRVILPSQLEDYTDRLREVELDLPMSDGGEATLADVIAALESRFRGLAFRIIDEQGNIRRHIAIFVGESMVRTLQAPVRENARVQIVGALSGG
ncbi:MAG: MoaD/ThiS family protein [Gammaproteobacteria bacterium]|nr:MoaD/ThiS family protein [Gammaproteobacteria bacterium]